MATLVILAAVGSIAATLLLTFVLYRMNAPKDGAAQRDGAGDGGPVRIADDGNGGSDGGGD